MLMCALVGMCIVFPVILISLRIASKTRLFQRGQELHHTHRQPTPRLGGLALAAAFIGVEVFIAVVWPEQRARPHGRLVVILSSLTMFALGFWDDLKPLGARRKLLGQVLIAATVYALGIGITHFRIPFVEKVIALGGWGALITVVWLVGMTNLINLIDGVDGLAGGICLMLMVLLAYVGYTSSTYALLVSGMAGALLGFLWFNFPPARIYLGDGGAYFLGFQIGLFSLVSSHKGTVLVALVAPLFVLAVPILDTALAILRRGLRGLPIFRPDRKHLHHHLLQSGMSRRKVVLFLYAVTALFLVMAFAAWWSRGNLIPVLLGAGTLVLLICAGRFRFSRSWFAVGWVVSDSLQMRQEIQYALALSRWLALEGNRRNSIEELWTDLVFAAQRLGFNSVKVALKDGQRVWEQTNSCQTALSSVEVLHGGRLGTLELKAASCEFGGVPDSNARRCERPSCPCIASPKLFEIMSELLAEGWVKAAGKMQNGDRTSLRFDTQRAPRENSRLRGLLHSAAPRQVPEAARKLDQTPSEGG